MVFKEYNSILVATAAAFLLAACSSTIDQEPRESLPGQYADKDEETQVNKSSIYFGPEQIQGKTKGQTLLRGDSGALNTVLLKHDELSDYGNNEVGLGNLVVLASDNIDSVRVDYYAHDLANKQLRLIYSSNEFTVFAKKNIKLTIPGNILDQNESIAIGGISIQLIGIKKGPASGGSGGSNPSHGHVEKFLDDVTHACVGTYAPIPSGGYNKTASHTHIVREAQAPISFDSEFIAVGELFLQTTGYVFPVCLMDMVSTVPTSDLIFNMVLPAGSSHRSDNVGNIISLIDSGDKIKNDFLAARDNPHDIRARSVHLDVGPVYDITDDQKPDDLADMVLANDVPTEYSTLVSNYGINSANGYPMHGIHRIAIEGRTIGGSMDVDDAQATKKVYLTRVPNADTANPEKMLLVMANTNTQQFRQCNRGLEILVLVSKAGEEPLFRSVAETNLVDSQGKPLTEGEGCPLGVSNNLYCSETLMLPIDSDSTLDLLCATDNGFKALLNIGDIDDDGIVNFKMTDNVDNYFPGGSSLGEVLGFELVEIEKPENNGDANLMLFTVTANGPIIYERNGTWHFRDGNADRGIDPETMTCDFIDFNGDDSADVVTNHLNGSRIYTGNNSGDPLAFAFDEVSVDSNILEVVAGNHRSFAKTALHSFKSGKDADNPNCDPWIDDPCVNKLTLTPAAYFAARIGEGAHLDTDGDGTPDEYHTLNLITAQ